MTTTIILPISRPDFLREVFTALEFLECDPENTRLLSYIDGDHMLYEKGRHFTMNSKFTSKKPLFRARGPANVSSIRRRRKRIADIHNEIKKEVDPCDFVFLLEDDTVIPPQTFYKLHNLYTHYPHAGFVSGVELGRWGFPYIGAWTVDDVYDVNWITSIPLSARPEENIQTVDAAGFYCMMSRYDHYTTHDFSPFDTILGPDITYGISLRKDGHQNYVDTSIRCRHLTKKGEVTFQNTDAIQYDLVRNGDTWEQGQL